MKGDVYNSENSLLYQMRWETQNKKPAFLTVF